MIRGNPPIRNFAALLLLAAAPYLGAASVRLPLAGTWGFRLDSANQGHVARWYEQALDQDVIFLPGSTDQAGFGTRVVQPETGWLTRPYKYEGAAWYQREVVIPESWRGQRITLFLERPHWQTEVWVDATAFGSQNSLSTPHEYDLTAALTPGRHRITICVDNSYRIDVGRNAHSVTEHTQTNWNGIVGAIELRASAPVWIDSVAIYPDAQTQRLRAAVVIGNRTESAVDTVLSIRVPELGGSPVSRPLTIAGAEQQVEMAILAGVRRWDEYEPSLYSLEVRIDSRAGADTLVVPFGVREIGTRGTQFILNGRPIFLRGTLECAIFPRTGYPSTRVEDWERLFRIARSYGLNAFRFHSWCPPEAAFVAADRAGFLLHVELPVWSAVVGKDPVLDDFMRAEGRRILKAYGNHPSFTMLCLGNELTGDDQFMDASVAEFKRDDPRRLYTFSADHRRREPGVTSDYYVTQQTTAGRLRINGTRFGRTQDGTDHDFSPSVKAVPMPLVAHELGQWAVFPSYAEIARYTGVLKPRNLEPFRGALESRGMIDEAEIFQKASGQFSWEVYKEDFEAAFRTPGLGGFFMLQLEDFPGQGEALVGLLDSFWESKGILTPEQFRRFCSETVPLLRMKKFVWTAGETFTAHAEVAHYGKQTLANAVAEWSMTDDSGRVLHSGEFPARTIGLGSVTGLGDISLPLAGIGHATHLTVTVQIRGTAARNDWNIWVYPETTGAPAGSVMVTGAFDAAARRALADGRSVLLTVPRGAKGRGLLPIRFLPVFWSNAFFGTQPGTMGILCDPAHPALAEFPTEMHSDWQWWELTEGANAMILDDTPPGFRAIVQVIDDFHRNHKLGAVLEARVGAGKLIMSSLDLSTDLDQRPVARELLRSLLDYANGPKFEPRERLTMEQVAAWFETR